MKPMEPGILVGLNDEEVVLTDDDILDDDDPMSQLDFEAAHDDAC